MARPSSDAPEWASDGGADISEPAGGKKALGWVAEKPPHEWFNWWQNRAWQWLKYLQELTNGAEGNFQLSNNRTVANVAPFIVSTSAEADANVNNEWKLVFQFQAGSNRRVHFYTGKAAQDSAFLIAVNAVWTPSSHTFAQINAANNSFGTIFKEGDVTFSKVTAGAGPWGTWPAGANQVSIQGGNLLAGDDITAAGSIVGTTNVLTPLLIASTLVQAAEVQSVGDITTTGAGNIISNHNIRADEDFQYTVARTVRQQIAPGAMTPRAGATYDSGSGEIVGNNSGVTSATVQIHVPDGATLTSVQVQVTGVTPGDTSFQVVRRTQSDWSAGVGAPPVEAAIGSGPFGTTGSGLETIQSTAISQLVATANITLEVRVTIEQNSLPARVHGVRFTYTQPRL